MLKSTLEPFTTINELPEEIIIQILLLLDIESLKTAVLAQKYWYELSQKQCFIQRQAVHLKRTELSETNDSIRDLTKHGNYFGTLRLENVTILECYHKFWNKFGEMITELHLEHCELSSPVFYKILTYIPSLKKLTIKWCDDALIMNADVISSDLRTEVANNLIAIDELTISADEKLTKEIFKSHFGGLTKLHKFCFTENMSKRMACTDTIDFIKQNSATLKHLDINFAPIIKPSDVLISALANMENLRLKSFKTRYNKIDPGVFEDFCAKQTALEELVIFEISRSKVHSIAQHLVNLRHLVIGSSKLARDAIAELSKLRKLCHLNIEDVGIMEDATLLKLVEQPRNSLRYFNTMNPIISDEFLTKLSENCPNLVELHLRYKNSTPQRGFQMVFKNLTQLQVFNIRKDQSDEFDQELTDSDNLGYTISRLQKLKELKMGGNPILYGVEREEIFKLKELCEAEITPNMTLEEIIMFSKSFPKLKTLSIMSSSVVDDKLLTEILSNLKYELSAIFVMDCPNITTEAMVKGVLNWCPNLRKLRILRCYKLAYNISERLTTLPKLIVEYYGLECSVSEPVITHLRGHAPVENRRANDPLDLFQIQRPN